MIIKQKKNIQIIIVVLVAIILLGEFFYKYELPAPQTSNALSNEKIAGYKNFDEIPQNIINTIVSIEDKRFWNHLGVDPIAIARATYQTFIKKKIQGGSTIDQQLIKIIDQHFKRSRIRKIYEIIQATNLQFHYSKKTILLTYINQIPFSHGITGWKAACNIYFQKPCNYLSSDELLYLIAVGQLGANPYKTNQQPAIFARAKVLCNVIADKYTTIDCSQLTQSGNTIVLNSYTNEVDPKITSFIDKQPIELQHIFSLTQYGRIQEILKTTATHRQQNNVQDCCVVALDNAGGIISMNSCSSRQDPLAGKINFCNEARQVGSAIKPFLYMYAFHEKGLQATDIIVDEPISFDLGDGSTYSPKNFDLSYHGSVSIAYALGNSLNVPAIKTLHMVGVSPFLTFLKTQLSTYASGFDNNTKDAENVGLSLALGTYEISPYAFTQLRRSFLPGRAPYGYEKDAEAIRNILSYPINKIAAFGQDSFLNLPGRSVKTGTSRKFIDGRVCGVNAEKAIILCIWLGNSNNQAMKGSSSEVGSYLWNLIAKEL